MPEKLLHVRSARTTNYVNKNSWINYLNFQPSPKNRPTSHSTIPRGSGRGQKLICARLYGGVFGLPGEWWLSRNLRCYFLPSKLRPEPNLNRVLLRRTHCHEHFLDRRKIYSSSACPPTARSLRLPPSSKGRKLWSTFPSKSSKFNFIIH